MERLRTAIGPTMAIVDAVEFDRLVTRVKELDDTNPLRGVLYAAEVRAESAEAEVGRLKMRVSDLRFALGDGAGWFDRARAAEAEVKRLRAALSNAADVLRHYDPAEGSAYGNLIDRLDAALKETP